MDIIYKQPQGDIRNSSLADFGIKNCYLKKLVFSKDRGYQFLREHHHTFFEIHMLFSGKMVYYADGKEIMLCENDFLFIAPDTPHTAVVLSHEVEKYTILFEKCDIALCRCFFGKLSLRMRDNISFIEKEYRFGKVTSSVLVENTLFEMIVTILRDSGIKENEQISDDTENTTVTIAKQYIKDNIRISVTVSDVAEYCGLSSRQLTRLFLRFAEISPGDYIKQKRITLAGELLLDDSLTLKEISEYMNFSSEYYFNSFVKKYLGLPPGEYRKCFNK